ncbi:MAG: PilZ domain-containing protein [Eubacteriales bacterium]|nr:PilZ domain-containing protein [Eubacteriales bacterium]
MVEKRVYNRFKVDASIGLRHIDDRYPKGISEKKIPVNVINISKGGIAFKSEHKFELNSFYNTWITLDNKDSFDAVIEVVRMENLGEVETTYGCRFIGMTEECKFKIEVFQIVSNYE